MLSDQAAIRGCEAEEAQRRTVEGLRAELEWKGQLGALLSFCSAFQFEIMIPGDPTLVHTVTNGVAQLLHGKPGVAGQEFEITLALQEALANAVRHGCRGDRTKSIECRITYQGTSEVCIVVRDPGPGFDVGSVPSPLEETNLLRANGRGLFLISQLMDEVRFAEGGREIQMRKRRKGWRGTLHR